VEWDRDYIKWYIDGQVTRTLTTSESSKQLMYVLLNLAVGGSFVGPVTATFPAQLEVDYVRVYQLKNQNAGNSSVAPPFAMPTGVWKQIAIPSDAPAGENTPAKLFGDDFAGAYETKWTLYEFNSTTNSYSKVGYNSDVKRGKSYWLSHSMGSTVQMDLPLSSAITQTQSQTGCAKVDCYAFEPQIGGSPWHLAGNPFDETISTGDIRVVTNSTGACPTGCTLDEAKANNLVHNQMWSYVAPDYNVLAGQEPIDAWSGFWLKLLPGANGAGVKILFSR